MGSAAVAQTAGKTFECALPYREAMESLATLTVTEQSELKPMFTLGPGNRVEFAPGTTQVFGLAPSALSLSLREPGSDSKEQIYGVTFSATFPHDVAIDRVLIASSEFGNCGEGSTLCQRRSDPENGPSLTYSRDPFFNDGKNDSPSVLYCEYKLREEDVAE